MCVCVVVGFFSYFILLLPLNAQKGPEFGKNKIMYLIILCVDQIKGGGGVGWFHPHLEKSTFLILRGNITEI